MRNYPKSDHFDGSRFFNPTHPQGQRLLDVFKFLLSSKPKTWPKKVENKKKLNLNQQLGDHQIAVTFVNHASLLIQLKNYNILTDPVWSTRVSPVGFAGPKRVREPGINFEELPKIDLVVISHNHYDHMDLATIKKLNKKFQPQFVVALGDKEKLESIGVEKVLELDWWEQAKFGDLEVIFVPTQHFSGRVPFLFNKSLWGAYVIQVGGKKIYFGGDAGYSSQFTETFKRLGAMDFSFIPIGAYEPRWFMKPVHMNPEEAVQAHIDLHSKKSIGIHFGTFQLTEEAIDQPVKDLHLAMASRLIPSDQFVTLHEGQTENFNWIFPLHCIKQ